MFSPVCGGFCFFAGAMETELVLVRQVLSHIPSLTARLFGKLAMPPLKLVKSAALRPRTGILLSTFPLPK